MGILPEEKGFESLCSNEKLIFSVFEMVRILREGECYSRPLGADESQSRLVTGLETYLKHGARDRLADARRGLITVGASATANILERTKALFDPAGISPVFEMRYSQVSNLSPQAKQALEQLGLEIKAEPDKIIVKLHAHVIANPSAFPEMAGEPGCG